MKRTYPVIIGRSGQLAQSLASEAGPGEAVSRVFLGRPEFDLLDSDSVRDTVRRLVDGIRKAGNEPVIVNASAYTNVRAAETSAETAHALNAEAAGVLAGICDREATCLIHISTDYVFDGRAAHPYRETDPTAPLTVYGQSKRLGEEAVRAAGNNHLIVRTAWLYSPFGRNFLSIMKQRAETGDTVRVVDDQTGCPTSAIDLANAVLSLANHIAAGSTARGTYHFCGPSIMTWHAFARAIFRQVAGEAACRRVLPISSDEFGDDVPRPAYSALDCQAIKRDFGIEAPAMEASMTRDIGKMDALSSG